MGGVRLGRVPFLALAMATLLAALWGGLLRLHWRLPAPQAHWISYHGPLMVSGFLGTVISLERAVAFRAWPAYLVPLLTGVGGLCLIVGLPYPVGATLLTLGSAGLVVLFALFLRRQPTLFTLTMAIGAVAWLAGNLLWLSHREIPELVPWWIAFLVATIAGERLELTRFLPPTRWGRTLFLLAVAVLLVGVALSTPFPDLGVRLMGAGLAGLAAWLVRFDVARRTVRQEGLPRFVAACLLSGYVWLGAGGVLAMTVGAPRPDLLNDALLHALFVGFVFVMIFGHAPIIFPAVLGVPVAYHPRFYLHLALLHASLLLRIAGDLGGIHAARQWGGLGNAIAILFFLVNTVSSLQRRRPSPG